MIVQCNEHFEVIGYAKVGNFEDGFQVPEGNLPDFFFEEFIPRKFKFDFDRKRVTPNDKFEEILESVQTAESDVAKLQKMIAQQSLIIAQSTYQTNANIAQMNTLKAQVGQLTLVVTNLMMAMAKETK